MTISLHGEISRIVFQGNDDFVIAQLRTDHDVITIMGNIPDLRHGAVVDIVGEEEEHPKYGKQVRVTACNGRVPESVDGIAKVFEKLEGVGEVKAKILARHLVNIGVNATASEIADCQDIDSDLAEEAAKLWTTQRAKNKILAILQSYGLTPLQSDRAYMRWTSEAVKVVEENPYIICELPRVGFKVADEIARSKFGIEYTDARRIKQGILYSLKSICQQEGHTGYPPNKLIKESARILGVMPQQVEPCIEFMVKENKLDTRDDLVFLHELSMAEVNVADRLVDISITRRYQRKLRDNETHGLTKQQKEAVSVAIENGGLIVLTGGPGTGKTHTTKSIIAAWKKTNTAVEADCEECNGHGCTSCFHRGYSVTGAGRPVYLAAPTGRAAKRMEEMSGCEAFTIHRLLKCRPSNDGFTWGRKRREIDGLVIIDEASMLDTSLASALLTHISDNSTVVFVGDPDQLPSVGPGYVLHDIMNSGVAHVVKLTQIHRQKQGSGIIQFAHDLQQGKHPTLEQKDDFKIMRVDSAENAERAVMACMKRLQENSFRLPNGKPIDVWNDVQILSPMRKEGRSASSESINDLIQHKRFQDTDKKFIKVYNTMFYETDRVMQVSNNYDMGVHNGDVGTILEIDTKAKNDDTAAIIEFDGQKYEYNRSDMTELVRSYCCTIHKSQGSEYPIAVVVITGSHHFMLQRTLLYTGITRAREMAILIYDNKGLKRSVENNPPNQRYRALLTQIKTAIRNRTIEPIEI